MIDDYMEFDTEKNEIVAHKILVDQPWMHIILKVWAKINHGYDNLYECEPFLFVKTFSFPDW